MKRTANITRRADLEAAAARAKPKDLILLQDLAKIYGTSKTNFVNVLREIEKLYDVPVPVPGPHGAHLYPARKTLLLILRFEKRHDDLHASLQARTAAIMGKGIKGKVENPEDVMLPIGEIATLSRVMAETEERERDQGLYVPIADVAATAGRVFSMLSGYLSTLEAHVDPNGLLSPQIRGAINMGGKDLSLQIHAEMKDMLSGHASPKPRQSKTNRSANGRAGKARARRKGR